MIGNQVLLDLLILAVILGLAITFAKQKEMHRFFSVLGAAWVVIVDRYVKRLVAANLALGESADMLPGVMRLQRVHNYGAAWSSLSGARWLLIGVTAVGLGVLAWVYFKIVRHPLGVWALALVIGGGIGNLIDRVKLGYVIDMFATEFINFPVFNVADIFVTCGAVAAAIYYLKYYEKCDVKNWEKKTDDGTDPSDDGKQQQ